MESKHPRCSPTLCGLLLLTAVAACASPPVTPLDSAPASAPARSWAFGGELQLYPAGAVGTVHAERTVSDHDSLFFRAGYNVTERGDFGEHDDEDGGGPGFGVVYRHAFTPRGTDGWFAGARADLWWLDIDWSDDPSTGFPGGRSGSTDVLVLQPAAEAGYGWWLDSGRLDATLSLGVEINVDTDGEDVGEGAILLVGLRYSIGR